MPSTLYKLPEPLTAFKKDLCRFKVDSLSFKMHVKTLSHCMKQKSKTSNTFKSSVSIEKTRKKWSLKKTFCESPVLDKKDKSDSLQKTVFDTLLVCVTLTVNKTTKRYLSLKTLTTIPHSWLLRMTVVITFLSLSLPRLFGVELCHSLSRLYISLF